MPRLPFVTMLALIGSSPALLAADWKADPPAKVSDWKPATGLPLDLGKTLSHVDFADHFGPFALVTEKAAGKERIVFDMSTGREVARVPQKDGAVYGSMPDIPSPDGTSSARTPLPLGKFLEVTTLADGTVRKVELPFNTAQYAWLDSKRLAIVGGYGKTQIAVVDADTGIVGKPAILPGIAFAPLMAAGRNFATSPGGRYAGIATDKGIVFFDATSSTTELMIAMPLIAAKSPIGTPVPPAVAFSADGTKLAMLDGVKLSVWTAGTATPTSAAVVRGKRAGGTDVRSLQSVRSGGWIIDDENVTDAAGEEVRMIPYDGRTISALLALDADTILAARAAPGGPGHTLAVVRESGAFEKPAVAGDTRKARKIEPNAAPFLGAFESAVKPHRLPMARVTPGETPFAALHVARTGEWAVLERDYARAGEASFKRSVSVWDGAGVGAPVDLPAGRRVVGEMAGAAGFLTSDAKPGSPQATLAFHNAKGQMICRWRPADGGDAPLFAAVIDATRTVTLDRAGRLVGWKLPQCEAEWTLELPGVWNATLDPRGDRVLIGTPKGLHVVDPRSGDSLGILLADLGGAPFQGALCVRGDGAQVVALRLVGFGQRFVVWDLAGDRTPKSYAPPIGTADKTLIHLGGDLVFNGINTFDVRRGVAVWVGTDFLSNMAATQPSDGRIWHLATSRPGTFFYAAQAVPFPRRGIEGALAESERATERILQPGDRVKLVLDFSGAPERHRLDAQKAVAARLVAGRLTVDDDAPVTLTLRSENVPTGETLRLSWQDDKKLGDQETVKPYSVRCTAELRSGGRVVLPAVPYDIKMDPIRPNSVVTITDDSKTAKEFFERKVWNRVVQWAAGAVPGPTSVSTGGTPIIFPLRGRLKDETLETDWPKGYSPPAEPTWEMASDEAPRTEDSPAAARSKWIWIAGGCAGVLVVGIAALGLLVILVRRKPAPEPQRPVRKAMPRKRRVDPEDE